jgi:hypothetical protein
MMTNSSIAGWNQVQHTWFQAKSFLSAVKSRGLAATAKDITIGCDAGSRTDNETLEQRRESCFGNKSKGFIPCIVLKKSSEGFHYCGACGCGKNPLALLDDPENPGGYTKLHYPELQCPLKRRGFSNYSPESSINIATSALYKHFILLSHWNGRFGNRMHQYAYGVTYSKINNVDFILPSDWEGTHLFKKQYHIVSDNDKLRLHLNQTLPQLDTDSYRKTIIKTIFPTAIQINPDVKIQTYEKNDCPVFFNSICAYSENIFEKMNKKHLLEVFEFSDEVKNTKSYNYWKNRQGTYDVAHLRRDDISNVEYNKNNVQGYSVISKESYFKAFKKFGYDSDKIDWVSDDYTNKWHIKKIPSQLFGWSYPVGSIYKPEYIFDWLDDFLKLYFARSIFRANSSFSWWAAFLSPTAKVFSPIIDKKHIYGIDGMEEINVDFVEGNSPHWMHGVKDININ